MTEVMKAATSDFLLKASMSSAKHEGCEISEVLRRWLYDNHERFFSDDFGGYTAFLMFMVPVMADFRGRSLLAVSEVGRENLVILDRLLTFLGGEARELFSTRAVH